MASLVGRDAGAAEEPELDDVGDARSRQGSAPQRGSELRRRRDNITNNPEDFILWIETLGMSLAQSWAVQDILVIIIRNNVSFLKASVRKIRYQLMEKFFVGPTRQIYEVLRAFFDA